MRLARLPPPRLLLGLSAFAALAFVLSLLAFSLWNVRAAERWAESVERDPDTQLIVGTEPLELGPPDAGVACLLLHGFVGSRRDFADLGERLAEQGYFVRLALFPGHGTSPADFARTSPEDLIEYAREEFDDLRKRFPRVVVIGFSMGGAVSTILASEKKGDLSGLVLVAPYYAVTFHAYYVLPPSVWNDLLAPFVPYVPKGERWVQVNRRESVKDIFSYHHIPTEGARTLARLGELAREPATLGAILTPTLVLHAEGDNAASPDATRRAFENIGASDKRIVWYTRRSNHHLLWDYDAEDVKRQILEFIAQREAAAKAEPQL